ncbi:hypothetical protein AMECASPLE_023756 [Ameca splendens]|uniref:Uncharacterized protein n=1 Tax=Ameca splendens TaxID=208324 RepID=A0ABV0XT35_9TELE
MVDPSLCPDRKFCSQDRKTGGFSRDSGCKHYCCGVVSSLALQARDRHRKQTVPPSRDVHYPWVTYALLSAWKCGCFVALAQFTVLITIKMMAMSGLPFKAFIPLFHNMSFYKLTNTNVFCV